jgi:hypothetical protein
MIRFYFTEKISKIPIFVFFGPNLNPNNQNLFQKVSVMGENRYYTEVMNPQNSDFIVIPYNFYSLKNYPDYIVKCQDIAKRYGKKLLIFAYGDSDRNISIDNSVIVRSSQYRYKLALNEIIMPAIVEDISGQISYRSKSGPKPLIGFVGRSGFSNIQQRIKYSIRLLYMLFLSTFIRTKKLHIQGLFYRRKCISTLKKSHNLILSIIERKSYSGHKKTIEVAPEIARKEFIDNIVNSDFSLSIKGDGNYSLRFYEILSAGRVPLFIDTDCPLPLEDIINYDEFILRIDYKNINNVDKIVSEFYRNLSEETYFKMQKSARYAFENYLSTDSFFRILCDRLKTFNL